MGLCFSIKKKYVHHVSYSHQIPIKNPSTSNIVNKIIYNRFEYNEDDRFQHTLLNLITIKIFFIVINK